MHHTSVANQMVFKTPAAPVDKNVEPVLSQLLPPVAYNLQGR